MNNDFDSLCKELLMVSSKEQENKARRIEIEEAISVGCVSVNTHEGITKVETDLHRVTVTRKLTRSLNYGAYLEVEKVIPEQLRCVEMKPTINLSKLKIIDMTKPSFSASFITTKPAKSSVKVEVK